MTKIKTCLMAMLLLITGALHAQSISLFNGVLGKELRAASGNSRAILIESISIPAGRTTGTAVMSAAFGSRVFYRQTLLASVVGANTIRVSGGSSFLRLNNTTLTARADGTVAASGSATTYDPAVGTFTLGFNEVFTSGPIGKAPSIAGQSGSVTGRVGQSAAFSVSATGTPAPTFTWQRRAAGSSVWASIANGSAYQGVNTSRLTVLISYRRQSGDAFRCVVSNAAGTVTSSPATLTVR